MARRTPPARPQASARPAGRWSVARILVVVLLLVGAALVAQAVLTLPSRDEISRLAEKPPQTTALIEARAREAKEAHKKARRMQRWVPIAEVAPEAIACVLASEDARFFLHDGVDVKQLGEALKKDLATHRYARGASTLTQQLAKNLWLSENKSVLRKLQELYLAHRLEEELTKERILELYLNEVEWGDGIYGISAGSRAYFGKTPRDLSLAEGAILAAMLPNPRHLTPQQSPKALLARARHVLDRVAEEHLASAVAVDLARVELERTLNNT